MTEKYIYIEPLNETLSVPYWTTVDIDRNSLADSVHKLIDCRCFGAVDVLLCGTPYVLLVDDDGLLKDNWTPNVPAWFWYSQFNIDAPIAGKVLVCKEGIVDGEYDIVGLEPYDLELISRELAIIQRLTNAPSTTQDPS